MAVTPAAPPDRGRPERLRDVTHPFVAFACVWLLAVSSAGCERKLHRRECEQLLDRYVELLARTRRPDASPAELLRLQLLARQRAARNPGLSDCSAHVSRRAFECAMRQAQTADELERCLL
jgi:hypothetical protein